MNRPALRQPDGTTLYYTDYSLQSAFSIKYVTREINRKILNLANNSSYLIS